jgi:anti-sigma factor RsiW
MSETHPGEDLIALALDDLHPRARAATVEHLLACPRCREEYDAVAATVEGTLLAAPAVGPPPGFEKRVLAALGVEAPADAAEPARQADRQQDRRPARQPDRRPTGKHLATRARRPRLPVRGQWLLVAAAAVIGLALGAVATHALQDDTPSAPTAQRLGSQLSKVDGTVVGAVTSSSVGSEKVYVVMVSDGPVGMRYKCQLKLADGRTVAAGRVLLEKKSAVWVLPAQPQAVELVLIAHNGKGPLWSTATL